MAKASDMRKNWVFVVVNDPPLQKKYKYEPETYEHEPETYARLCFFVQWLARENVMKPIFKSCVCIGFSSLFSGPHRS